MKEPRIITSCAAVHPDQRGGQHVAMSCPGVLAIDDDREIGVLVATERSQMANKRRALALLSALTLTAEDVEALREVRRAIDTDDAGYLLAVLDRIIEAHKEQG